jgi:hypothetical protein
MINLEMPTKALVSGLWCQICVEDFDEVVKDCHFYSIFISKNNAIYGLN